MELIEMLASQLGISETQAEGGAGLLLGMARKKLGEGDFGEIATAVPGIEALVESAPSGGIGGMLGGFASKVGGEDLGGLAGLAGGFKKLGLDAGLISKFVPIVLSFVQSKGGDVAKGILERVLS